MTVRLKLLIAALLAGGVLAAALLAPASSRRYCATRAFMGTEVSITVISSRDPGPAMDAAFKAIEAAEGRLSRFKPDSDVSRINRLGIGRSMDISRETFRIIEKSIATSRISDGAFDVTVLPLIKLYPYGKEGKLALPERGAIDEAKKRIGSDKIVLTALDDKKLEIGFKVDGMEVDLGGIAKGYAVDTAIAALRHGGITSGIVEAGGDLYCMGRRPDGSKWTVAVRNPRGPGGVATLCLANLAVATSGDYERFFVVDGRRYSHIIDPRTGMPVARGVASASVVASDCETADALATAVSVLGAEKGMELIERLPGVECMMLVEDAGGGLTEVRSSGWEGAVGP